MIPVNFGANAAHVKPLRKYALAGSVINVESLALIVLSQQSQIDVIRVSNGPVGIV